MMLFISASVVAVPKAPKGDPIKGEAVFSNYCTSCHVLGGKLIGPNLIGVKDRWPDYNKLVDFVQHPSNYIDKDPYIIKLQKEYNNAVMNVGNITAQQAADVVEYAHAGGTGVAVAAGGAGVSFMPVPQSNSNLKYLFIGILIILGVIGYLVFKLKKSLKPEEGKDLTHLDRPSKHVTGIQKINAFIFPIFFILAMIGLYADISSHSSYLRPVSASVIGADIDRLFWNTFKVTAIVFFITHILLFYYVFKYRGSDKRKALFLSHNNTVEFVWTIIPALVLSFLVLDGFKTWRRANAAPDNNSLTIEAFAKQFDWTIRYPGKDGKLGKSHFLKITSDNPLGIDFSDPASKDDYLVTDVVRLPLGRPVHILLRSQDVTHAAYFPHFRMQMYANPGMDNRLTFTPSITTATMRKKVGQDKFDYEMACNQLCGGAHWNMRRVVQVDENVDYLKWESDTSAHKPAIASYKGENISTALNTKK
ncbi:MAG: cytochrome c oxidase subunit II transmembrane domain-containing protein [Bacteroidota bacterium]|nr:cytochrome c oxidase subunit II transmembrane domain-containing protein [Bacteroidota bacterium]